MQNNYRVFRKTERTLTDENVVLNTTSYRWLTINPSHPLSLFVVKILHCHYSCYGTVVMIQISILLEHIIKSPFREECLKSMFVDD